MRREGVDVVLDTVGGATLLQSIDATRLYGRLITLHATPIDRPHANKARARNLTIGYEGMTAPVATGNHRARLTQTRILEQGARLFDQGKLRVTIAETFLLPLAFGAVALAFIMTAVWWTVLYYKIVLEDGALAGRGGA